MNSSELTFSLIKGSKCPFYEIGDEFKLSGNAILLEFEGENTFISTAIVRLPSSKESCRTLIGDLTNLLIRYENIDKIPDSNKIRKYVTSDYEIKMKEFDEENWNCKRNAFYICKIISKRIK